MKLINVVVDLTWGTQLEVPDDFVPSPESIEKLLEDERGEFDFSDGSLCPYAIQCTEVTEDGDDVGEPIDTDW